MIQEVICNCCSAFVRLLELGKADLAYPTVLARYGIAQVKAGRKVGGQLNCRDVLSEYCQQRKNIFIERLDSYDTKEDSWQEIVVEDKHAGPAEVAATRIDFAAWLKLMPHRLQKIVTFLATGESTAVRPRNSAYRRVGFLRSARNFSVLGTASKEMNLLWPRRD